MKEFLIECFEVTESYDRDSKLVAYVSTKELATALVAKSKCYRTSSAYKKLIVVFDTMEEIEANTKEALIKSAKAKLTPAERQALGL